MERSRIDSRHTTLEMCSNQPDSNRNRYSCCRSSVRSVINARMDESLFSLRTLFFEFNFELIRCDCLNNVSLSLFQDDDECRWRLLFFNMNMNLIRQSEILENASTLDWNLLFSYVNDRQTFIIDGTTENCYLLTVSNDNASIKRRSFSQSACPVSVCTITNDGLTQIIVKMIRPNTFRFFSV